MVTVDATYGARLRAIAESPLEITRSVISTLATQPAVRSRPDTCCQLVGHATFAERKATMGETKSDNEQKLLPCLSI